MRNALLPLAAAIVASLIHPLAATVEVATVAELTNVVTRVNAGEKIDGEIYSNNARSANVVPTRCVLRENFTTGGADCNVREFGAKGDGVTLDTTAIQQAIDVAAEKGGRVVLPPGVYKSGTIYLKSHVELHVGAGAVLLGSERLEDYNALDAFPQNFQKLPNEGWQGKHLVLCLEQEDVSITGEGTIDGNGRAYFDSEPYMKGPVAWRFGGRNARDRKNCIRPGQVVEFCESNGVRVKDIRIVDPTAWSLFFHGCENVQVRGVRVEADIRNMNTDGIDIDSCRNVTVSDCIITTGDDAIAIRGAPARLKGRAKACENVTVASCVACVSATGCRIGVGDGVIRHVKILNFIVEKAGVGMHVQAIYGGKGGVDISDVSVSHSSFLDTGVAISVVGTADKRPRDIRFTDVYIEETDVTQEKMVRVDNADTVKFNACLIGRRGKPSRDLGDGDILKGKGRHSAM